MENLIEKFRRCMNAAPEFLDWRQFFACKGLVKEK